jgi:nitroimidazol reductase NimA-like FMN-containing flavoprotein (pyridoxamine 5'-phosphate oxidase superfamily)
MTDHHRPISILSETECWRHLASAQLGRLVTNVDGNPAIFPVNFVVQNRTILFRTAEGTKLVGAAMNNNVLFEADDHNVAEGWSVIVAGSARSLHTDEDIAEAERAQLFSWTATEKSHFIRIRPRNVTGRRFQFGAAPGRTLTAEDPVLG